MEVRKTDSEKGAALEGDPKKGVWFWTREDFFSTWSRSSLILILILIWKSEAAVFSFPWWRRWCKGCLKEWTLDESPFFAVSPFYIPIQTFSSSLWYQRRETHTPLSSEKSFLFTCLTDDSHMDFLLFCVLFHPLAFHWPSVPLLDFDTLSMLKYHGRSWWWSFISRPVTFHALLVWKNWQRRWKLFFSCVTEGRLSLGGIYQRRRSREWSSQDSPFSWTLCEFSWSRDSREGQEEGSRSVVNLLGNKFR